MKVSYSQFVWLAVASCSVSTSGAFAPAFRNYYPQQRMVQRYMSEPNGAAPQESEAAPAAAAEVEAEVEAPPQAAAAAVEAVAAPTVEAAAPTVEAPAAVEAAKPPAAAAAPPQRAASPPSRGPPNVRADVEAASNQKEYGVSLPMPETYVRCGRCQTTFALTVEDLGSRGNGARIACCVCDHSWYQSRDRLFDVRNGFEFIPLPDTEKERIAKNIEAGRSPDYVGEYKLYVGNLDFRCTETDLRDVFSKAGDIGEVNIVTDQETGRSRGFAFVTMINEADGIKAKEAYDGTELLGRQLSIREPNN